MDQAVRADLLRKLIINLFVVFPYMIMNLKTFIAIATRFSIV